MRYAMTTWKIATPSQAHTDALRAWKDHCAEAHPQIQEVRCYMFNGGTELIWLEAFTDYHAFQELQNGIDDRCEKVMGAVMEHAVPGTMRTGVWLDGI